MYIVSKGNVKMANKQYNHLNNDWEILLNATSTIYRVSNERRSKPTMHFNIKSINDIRTTNINQIFDVLGIVTRISNPCKIHRKYDSEVTKKIVNIQDMSRYNMDATFWGGNFDGV